MYRRSGTRAAEIPRTALLVFLGLGCAMYAFVIWAVLPASLERAEMQRNWPRAEATVTAVTREWSGRGGPFFALRLRAVLPNGDVLLENTMPGFGHPMRSSWSEPRRRPEPGDALTIVMDPDDPRRLATVASLGSPRASLAWLAILFVMLAFSVLMVAAGIHVRRHARADGSFPPTDA